MFSTSKTVSSTRIVALLIIALTQLSCSKQPTAAPPPSTPADNKLHVVLISGNSTIDAMTRYELPRDQDQYFSHYESLRHCYTSAADLLQAGASEKPSAATLATLTQWESAIKTARQKWQEIHDLPPAKLPPGISPEARPRLEEQLARMEQQSAERWETTTKLWAPSEARLDAAIETVHKLERN